VILIPKGTRSQQIAFFQKALDVFAARNDDLVNKVMEVHANGNVDVREWNAADHDVSHIGHPKR
jgi:hypothetical protein